MLALPSSTLRRYVKLYASRLSENATRPRGRRFSEADIANLARIRELSQQMRSPHEIESLLNVIDEGDAEPSNALALVPSIATALSDLTDAARSLRLEIDDLREDGAEANQKLENRLQELEEFMRLPWYKKLRNKPAPEK